MIYQINVFEGTFFIKLSTKLTLLLVLSATASSQEKATGEVLLLSS